MANISFVELVEFLQKYSIDQYEFEDIFNDVLSLKANSFSFLRKNEALMSGYELNEIEFNFKVYDVISYDNPYKDVLCLTIPIGNIYFQRTEPDDTYYFFHELSDIIAIVNEDCNKVLSNSITFNQEEEP